MNGFNEYDRLKRIYLKLTITTAIIAPITLFLGMISIVILLLTVLITNIYLYVKYYKKDDMGLFQENIRNILKKSMIAVIISIIFLLPLGSTLLLIGSGIYYSVMMIAVISMMIGFLISWIYYLYNLIKMSSNLDRTMFYQDNLEAFPEEDEIS